MAFLDPNIGGEVPVGGVTPAAAAAAAAGLTVKPKIGTPPNWQALIQGSPIYQSWLASKNRKLGSLATQRAGGIKGLVAKYGFLPKGFSDAFGDLSASDIAAGESNPFSIQNLIKKSYNESVFNDRRRLAARGGLQSGELGFAQNQEDTARDQQTYQAGTDLMAALQEILGGYAGGMEEALGGEGQAISEAQQGVLAQNPQGPQASLVSDSIQTYGFPVYRDESGGLWKLDASGNPVQFQAPAAAAPPPPPPPAPVYVGSGDQYQYGDIF